MSIRGKILGNSQKWRTPACLVDQLDALKPLYGQGGAHTISIKSEMTDATIHFKILILLEFWKLKNTFTVDYSITLIINIISTVYTT